MKNVFEFQGSTIVDIPENPGIYAWYYRPLTLGKREVEILGKLITSPSRVKTEITLRYGLSWTTDSDVDVQYGINRQPVNDILLDIVKSDGNLIREFFESLMIPYFAKPLYIGRTENLYQRVYKDHYISLRELWEPDTSVSRYLIGHPNATVSEVLEQLNLPHSFAVEARVKGVTPGDLRACVWQVEHLDNQHELGNLEQILQLLTDPICGRK